MIIKSYVVHTEYSVNVSLLLELAMIKCSLILKDRCKRLKYLLALKIIIQLQQYPKFYQYPKQYPIFFLTLVSRFFISLVFQMLMCLKQRHFLVGILVKLRSLTENYKNVIAYTFLQLGSISLGYILCTAKREIEIKLTLLKLYHYKL